MVELVGILEHCFHGRDPLNVPFVDILVKHQCPAPHTNIANTIRTKLNGGKVPAYWGGLQQNMCGATYLHTRTRTRSKHHVCTGRGSIPVEHIGSTIHK